MMGRPKDVDSTLLKPDVSRRGNFAGPQSSVLTTAAKNPAPALGGSAPGFGRARTAVAREPIEQNHRQERRSSDTLGSFSGRVLSKIAQY